MGQADLILAPGKSPRVAGHSIELPDRGGAAKRPWGCFDMHAVRGRHCQGLTVDHVPSGKLVFFSFEKITVPTKE